MWSKLNFKIFIGIGDFTNLLSLPFIIMMLEALLKYEINLRKKLTGDYFMNLFLVKNKTFLNIKI
jgi:hypothetical protein